LSADSGVLGSIELHQNLGSVACGSWQGLVFADSEHVTVNQNPWAPGSNGATMSGAGVGLNWSGALAWHAKLTVAAPIGTVPVLVNTGKKARAWIEIGTWF
jgi:hemolysin activation/secretion protein